MSKVNDDLPQIAALFVSAFHKREGYKIIWRKSEVDLGGCEYKTLPSGLEKVSDDVIYFTHGSYIGLAAYKNLQKAGEEREDLSCVSIGILVQADSHNLRHQRLNKIWLYNSLLKSLTENFEPHATSFPELEKLFNKYTTSVKKQVKTRGQSPPASPVLSRHSTFKNYQSFRAERQTIQVRTTSLLPTHELSNLHPVLSLHDCISLFGPLIFPVFRAALCRKRILLITEAPIQRACHFIYNIQLISAIPNNATTMKRPSPLRQLFCLGLNDISMLEKMGENEDQGWIGVTTDKVFETKSELWDLMIKLPADFTSQSLAEERARPTLTSSDGMPIKPSYLDAKNFNRLKSFLPLYRDTGLKVRPQPSWKRSMMDNILSGFWYWASAGQSLELEEHDIYLEHADEDDSIVADDHEEETSLVRTTVASEDSNGVVSNGRDEVVLLVLFHRMTTHILSVLDGLACESLDEIHISREQMVKIGLTPRLPFDNQIVEDLGQRWFARDVVVDKSFFPCC